MYTISVNDVAQKRDRRLREEAFVAVESEACGAQTIKDGAETLVVFLFVYPMDEDVVHVTDDTVETFETARHCTLEDLRSTADAKREAVETVSAERS